MALEVEDGTGKSNATSYISVADADSYFTARAIEAWEDADDTEKEAALVRATDALDSWARGRWKGTKKTAEQALAWPRTDVVDEDGFDVSESAVPNPVVRACAEVALIELSARFIQQTVTSADAVVSETVGPISVTYGESAPSMTIYPHIQALLRGLAAVDGNIVNFDIGLTQEELDKLNGVNNNDPFNFPEYFNLVKFP